MLLGRFFHCAYPKILVFRSRTGQELPDYLCIYCIFIVTYLVFIFPSSLIRHTITIELILVPLKGGHCDAVDIFQIYVILVIGILRNIGFTGRHLQHIKGVNIYVQQLLRMAFGGGKC